MKQDTKFGIIIGVVIVIVLMVLFRNIPFDYLTEDIIEITVTKTEREDSKNKYMVQTQEGEVFENTDTYTYWKYNSSDVQAQLLEGGKYKVVVCGWRWGWKSWYRNIINVEEIISKPVEQTNIIKMMELVAFMRVILPEIPESLAKEKIKLKIDEIE